MPSTAALQPATLGTSGRCSCSRITTLFATSRRTMERPLSMGNHWGRVRRAHCWLTTLRERLVKIGRIVRYGGSPARQGSDAPHSVRRIPGRSVGYDQNRRSHAHLKQGTTATRRRGAWMTNRAPPKNAAESPAVAFRFVIAPAPCLDPRRLAYRSRAAHSRISKVGSSGKNDDARVGSSSSHRCT